MFRLCFSSSSMQKVIHTYDIGKLRCLTTLVDVKWLSVFVLMFSCTHLQKNLAAGYLVEGCLTWKRVLTYGSIFKSNYLRGFHRSVWIEVVTLLITYFILYRFQCRHAIKGIAFKTPEEEWEVHWPMMKCCLPVSLRGLLYFLDA